MASQSPRTGSPMEVFNGKMSVNDSLSLSPQSVDSDILTMCLEDIPYHTFVDCIAIHLDMRDFGALSMMSVYLRDIFMSNDVWKRLYVNSLIHKFKITEKSVHVGKLLKNHKSRVPTPEVPYSGHPHWIFRPEDMWNQKYAFRNAISMCECHVAGKFPWWDAEEISDNAMEKIMDSLATTKTLHSEDFAKQCLHDSVMDYNSQQGHTHSHLCTNINHYLIDTLESPSSVRNYKDFRKQVLSKFLTQTKKDPKSKQSTARIKSRQKQIKRYQDALINLQKEIDKDTNIVDSQTSLCSSLSVALKKK